MLSAIGMVIETSIQAILASSPKASPYLFFLSAAVSGLTGGFVAAVSSTYSYLSDITDEGSRAVRFAALEVATMLTIPLRCLVDAMALGASGQHAVLVLAPCCAALSFGWVFFWLKEVKPAIGAPKRQMVRDLFRLSSVKASVWTFIRPRPNMMRGQLLVWLFVFCCLKISETGIMFGYFPETKVVYDFNAQNNSYAYTWFALLNASTTFVLIRLMNKKLLLDRPGVGLILITALMVIFCLLHVSFGETWKYYVACFPSVFYSCFGIVVLSRLSKIVGKDELGSVFSLLAICECFTPVMGTVIYMQFLVSPTVIFGAIIMPLSSIPTSIALSVLGCFNWVMKRKKKFASQVKEAEDNEQRTIKLANTQVQEAEADGQRTIELSTTQVSEAKDDGQRTMELANTQVQEVEADRQRAIELSTTQVQEDEDDGQSTIELSTTQFQEAEDNGRSIIEQSTSQALEIKDDGHSTIFVVFKTLQEWL